MIRSDAPHFLPVIILLMLFLLVSGCATAPTAPPAVARVEVVEVKVPVPVSCIPKDFPRSPELPDTQAAVKAAPSAEDRYRLIGAGWLLREPRMTLTERLIDACRDK